MTVDVPLAFALVSIASVITPSAAVLTIIRHTARVGPWRCAVNVVAYAVGLTVPALACGFALIAIVPAPEWLWFELRFGGVLYLAYAGLHLITMRDAIDPASRPLPASTTAIGMLLRTAANPRVVVSIAAILLQIIERETVSVTQILHFSATYFLLCVLIVAIYAETTGDYNGKHNNARSYQLSYRLQGITVLFCAIFFAREIDQTNIV